MARKILHVDLDAFFCAVEELNQPALRGKPFAVGGRPEARGVVSSCSYPARRRGVHSAMPMAHALRLCPNLIVVRPDLERYGEASRRVMHRLERFTARIEQVSIDEAFLDLSDLPQSGEELARKIQSVIRDELHLPCSIGVASNKLVAKIATDVGKKAAGGDGPPYAITVVPVGEEAAFLSPLPVEMLWGVGPKTAKKLESLGIHTIGELAAWPESELTARFGENGREMAWHARGLDERPVVTEHEVKSISQEVTFARDVQDDQSLERTLRELSAQVGRRLRKADLAGSTVKVKLRWPDFTTLTRQATLPTPTDQDDEIYETALEILRKVRPAGKAVRLIGVGVSGLKAPLRQLSLWGADDEKSRRLQDAVDSLREKYGNKAIQRGKAEPGRRAEHGWLHHKDAQEEDESLTTKGTKGHKGKAK